MLSPNALASSGVAVAAMICAAPIAQQRTATFPTAPVVLESPIEGGVVPTSGGAYFVRETVWGQEPWFSDGSPGGDRPLGDLAPGFHSSAPGQFFDTPNGMLFAASVPGLGREWWIADGTRWGTRLLRDLWPGGGSALPLVRHQNFAARIGSYIYFAADDGLGGSEVWRTDGTAAGTTVFASRSGSAGLEPSEMTAVGNELFMAADDGTGERLWVVDTALGTSRPVGGPERTPRRIRRFGSGVFYEATDPAHSPPGGLYFADSTTSTRLIGRTIGQLGFYAMGFADIGGRGLFFSADQNTTTRLWSTDGTANGTFVVDPSGPTGSLSSSEVSIVPYAGQGYFVTLETSGWSLWSSDGTAANTVRRFFLGTQNDYSPACVPVVHGGELFFTAHTPATGIELFKTTGHSAPSTLVVDAIPGSAGVPTKEIVSDGARLWYGIDDLCVTDGTAAGTAIVSSPPTYQAGRVFQEIRAVEDSLFATVNYNGGPFGARELLHADSAGAVTSLGTTFARLLEATRFRGELWYRDRDPSVGYELHRSDGTPSGTGLVFDLFVGATTGLTSDVVRVGQRLLFAGSSPTDPLGSLWSSDGTTAGTSRLVGPATTRVNGTVARGRFWFQLCCSTAVGPDVWSSDGTTAGTALALPGVTAGPTVAGDKLLVLAEDSAFGFEPRVSDGTPGGTQLLVDLVPGPASSDCLIFGGNGETAWFTATDSASVSWLWATDGTAAGTHQLVRIEWIHPVLLGRRIRFAGDRVFVQPRPASPNGGDLWVSDGTPAGTHPVRDISPGPASELTEGSITPVGVGRLVAFAASDGVDGLQVWVSDGSRLGTRQLGRIGSIPGLGATSIGSFTADSPLLHFLASDGATTVEPWTIDLAQFAVPAVFEIGAGCGTSPVAPPSMRPRGVSCIGSQDFGLVVDTATPNSPAGAFVSFARASTPIGPCTLELASPISFGAMTTGANGRAEFALPIPRDPTLIAMSVYVQGAVLEPAGPLLGVASLTQALHVLIGQ